MFRIEKGKYLTKEFYSQVIKCKKSKSNWKRECMNKLDNCGYEYNFIGNKYIEITKVPETVEERILDILLRCNIVDKQVLDNELTGYLLFLRGVRKRDLEFSGSPWKTRQLLINLYYGIDIHESTLRRWTSNLIKKGIFVKSEEKINWRTKQFGKIKYQEMVDGDEEAEKEREIWIEDRNKRLEAKQEEFNKLNGTTDVKCPNKWGATLEELWREYHAYYFSVAILEIGTDWTDESQAICYELFELIDEYLNDKVFIPNIEADSEYELVKKLENIEESYYVKLNTIEQINEIIQNSIDKNGKFIF